MLSMGRKMNAPAGWYPHPENPGMLRWWDGTQWTDQTKPQVLAPPLAPPKRKKGLAVAAAVLAVVGLVFLSGIFGKILLLISLGFAIAALVTKQRLKGLSIACLCLVPLGFFIAAIASAPSPKSEASEPVAVVETDYKELTDRDMALIIKDPDAHKDERVVIFAKVTQFDSATGECSFRGNASAVPVDKSWDYKENIFLKGGSGGVPCEELKDYVEDDEVKVLATSQGEVQYETAMRASLSAPQFRIDKIERLSK